MPLVKRIEFSDARRAITDPVTKFGGQPVWKATPQWPLSRETRNQMRFIGQIAMTNDVFPNAEGQVVYLFMTDEEDYVDGTWEPNGGENAAIIQPSENVETPLAEVVEARTGPTIQRYTKSLFSNKLKPKNVELSVTLVDIDEPATTLASQQPNAKNQQTEGDREDIQGNKIGGHPAYIQSEELPDDEETWQMLVQLDSTSVPFHLNFGDGGVSYVFVDEKFTKARLLWQC